MTDGILTQRIAELLTDGAIYGIDASPAMIEAAKSPEKFKDTPRSQLKYDVLDATKLLESMTTHTHAELTKDQLADCIENEVLDVMPGTYSKVFSNAALHWYDSLPLVTLASVDRSADISRDLAQS